MRWRTIRTSLPGAGLALALAAMPAFSANTRPAVRDDARVQAAVEDARSRFLPSGRLDRLDVTVLLAAKDGSWRRGSVGGATSWYPASCVKLGYAIAAVHWCEAGGRAADCLDEHVGPMLRVSDNVETGFVVDAITGAPNGPAEGADYDAWFARRLYTENLLTEHNLLAGQKFINKTYPTNSGEEPTGLEALARERYGRNAMNADGAANLMLALVSGEFGERGRRIHPLATAPAARLGAQQPGRRLPGRHRLRKQDRRRLRHARGDRPRRAPGRTAPHHRRVLERAGPGRARRTGPDRARRIREAPARAPAGAR